MAEPSFELPSIDASDVVRMRGVTLVDVRKHEAALASGEMADGAIYADPFGLHHEHVLMKTTGKLIFYCVKGHEVSQFAAALACFHKRDAAFVRGGFEALLNAGIATAAFRAGEST